MYKVPFTTLYDRYYSKPSRSDTNPKSRKRPDLEEQIILNYILELDS